MAEKVSHLYVQYANEYKDDTLSAEYLSGLEILQTVCVTSMMR